MAQPPGITLRVATAADETVLLTLFAVTRQFDLSAWPPTLQESFLQMQFVAQSAHYRSAFPNAQDSLVLASGTPAGRIYLDRQEATIHILDFALLPEYRHRGIGRSIISGLQSEAKSVGKILSGHVANTNAAQQFWQRMGFQITPQDQIYSEISWTPPRQPISP